MHFCLIGAGRAGLVHAKNLTTRIKGVELVALCDANCQTLNKTGDELGIAVRYDDYREAVRHPGLDAVVIVTPTFLHRDIACAAAEAGKHVFLEKPMAITVEQCREIVAAVEKARVKLQIGFMRRFDEGFLEAKALLDSGEMGRVMTVKSTGRGPGLPPPWIYDIAASNGVLAEVNSHDFDSLRWLAGSDIRRVYAEAGNFKCPDVAQQWPRFYDNAVVSLRFDNGALGMLDGTCPAHYGYDARMEVLCENGVLVVGSPQQPGVTRIRRDGHIENRTVKSWRNLFKDAYVAELEHFVQCVREDRPPRVSGWDGLQAVAAVVAANRSILEGRPVEVPA